METKSKALTVQNDSALREFTREQIDLIKRTVAKNTTDDELQLFLYVAKVRGLDPLTKQIHAVKRWDSSQQKQVMTIQTGIDGYRVIADRTGDYCPGRETTFTLIDGPNTRPDTATVYIKRFIHGEWHEISATARYDEYVGKTKDGKPNRFWRDMPHVMLAKCAEALALRKAFPNELSGLYTHAEMQQADEPLSIPPADIEQSPKHNLLQAIEILKSSVKDFVISSAKELKQDPSVYWWDCIERAIGWQKVPGGTQGQEQAYATWDEKDIENVYKWFADAQLGENQNTQNSDRYEPVEGPQGELG